MLGLGNSRRGMKSPPLLIAGLFACVFVLGINYWITSTRCADLQHQLAELEGRMRRAAAERGAVEIKKNEFEEKLEKQREQIDIIQSLHSSQMKDAENEKNFLLSNITSQEKIIQKLQDETRTLQMNYDKQHQEMELFREGQAKKLDYELTQCSIKMKELTEQCEEKLKTITDKNGGTLEVVVGNADVKPAEKSKTLPSPHEEPVVQQPATPQANKDVKEKKETSDNKAPKPSTKEEQAIQVNPAGNPGNIEEKNVNVQILEEEEEKGHQML